ncbi:hypothetical protein Bbelb_128020 [Branchiostoma belcheri]|nr:hypothetical protein Bbelb_128020 [Branchiostoma belcheri]
MSGCWRAADVFVVVPGLAGNRAAGRPETAHTRRLSHAPSRGRTCMGRQVMAKSIIFTRISSLGDAEEVSLCTTPYLRLTFTWAPVSQSQDPGTCTNNDYVSPVALGKEKLPESHGTCTNTRTAWARPYQSVEEATTIKSAGPVWPGQGGHRPSGFPQRQQKGREKDEDWIIVRVMLTAGVRRWEGPKGGAAERPHVLAGKTSSQTDG